MISAQTLRVCREGKPVPAHRVVARGHAFPDHALEIAASDGPIHGFAHLSPAQRGERLVLLSQKATVTGISESFMEANRTEATGAGMGRHGAKDIESRFTGYVEELVSVIGHADRAGPFRDYCTGLVMPGERKSVKPMAAITAA